MWDCDSTSQFWRDIKEWMNYELGVYLAIDYKTICFGLLADEFDYFKNIILLLAKHYIYICRVEEKSLNVHVFKEWVKIIEKAEKIIAMRNGKQNSHAKRWGNLA